MAERKAKRPKRLKQPKRPRGRKGRRRAWRVVACAAIGLIVFVALLPRLCSLPPIRRAVAALAGEQINGSVTFDALRLRWFGSVGVEGLHVADAAGRPVADADSVRVSSGLAALLLQAGRSRQVTVHRPRLRVTIDEQGRTNLQALIPAREAGPPRPERPAGDTKTWGEVRVILTDGHVSIDAGGPPFHLRELAGDIAFEDVARFVQVNVAARAGAAGSPVAVEGGFEPQSPAIKSLADIDFNVDVTATRFQLAEIAPALERLGVPVQASGLLDTKLSLTMSPFEDYEVNGSLAIEDATLTGRALHGDRPHFDRIEAEIEANATEQLLTIETFRLTSPVGTATAQGEMSFEAQEEYDEVEHITAQATVRIDELARRLPNTLHLRRGTAVESGTGRGQVTVRRRPGSRIQAELALKLDDLAASRDGTRIAMEKPVTVNADVRYGPKALSVESLALDSSFATVKGSGTPQSFSVVLACDLGAATREAAKFLELGGRAADGRLRVDVGVEPTGGPRSALSVRLRGTGVAFTGPKGGRIEEKALRASLTGQALLELDGGPQDVTSVSLRYHTSAVSGMAQADRVALAGPTLAGLGVANGFGRAQVDLERLHAWARALGGRPAGPPVTGRGHLSGSLAAEKGVWTVTNLDAGLTDLDLPFRDHRMRYPNVRVSGGLTVAPARRALTDAGLTVRFPPGRVAFARLAVADWRTGEGLTAKAEGTLNVVKLREALGKALGLPDDLRTTGQLTFQADVGPGASEAERAGTLAVRVRPLTIHREGMPHFEEESIALDIEAVLRPAEEALALNRIALTSRAVRLAGTGMLADWSGARRITSRGMLAVNLDHLAPLAAAVLDREIAIEGNGERPYTLEVALRDEPLVQALARASASAGIAVERARYLGVETGAFTLPLRAEKGVVTLPLDVPVHGGRLLGTPTLDMRKSPAVLRLADATPMLKGVKVTDRMAGELLAIALPVFEGALRAEGTVDLDVAEAALPLVDDIGKAATLRGELRLSDVTFQTDSWLAKVLALARLDRRGIIMPDQRVKIAFKDRRFEHGRLVMAVDKYPVLVSGSVGLDRSLDMLIELPITRELVRDKRLYELLKGQTIKLPVTGTTKLPRFDASIIQRNLRGLMKHAAETMFRDRLRDLFD